MSSNNPKEVEEVFVSIKDDFRNIKQKLPKNLTAQLNSATLKSMATEADKFLPNLDDESMLAFYLSEWIEQDGKDADDKDNETVFKKDGSLVKEVEQVVKRFRYALHHTARATDKKEEQQLKDEWRTLTGIVVSDCKDINTKIDALYDESPRNDDLQFAHNKTIQLLHYTVEEVIGAAKRVRDGTGCHWGWMD